MKAAYRTLNEQSFFDINMPFLFTAQPAFEIVFSEEKKQLTYSAFVNVIAQEPTTENTKSNGQPFLLSSFRILDPAGIGSKPTKKQIDMFRDRAIIDIGLTKSLQKMNPNAPRELSATVKAQILNIIGALPPSDAIADLANADAIKTAEIIPIDPKRDNKTSISLAFYIADELNKLLAALNTACIKEREKNVYIADLMTDTRRTRLFPRIFQRGAGKRDFSFSRENAVYGDNYQAFKNELAHAIESELDSIRKLEAEERSASNKRSIAKLPRSVTTGLKKNYGRKDVKTPTPIDVNDVDIRIKSFTPEEMKQLVTLEGSERHDAINEYFSNLPFVNWKAEQSICYIRAQSIFSNAAVHPDEFRDKDTTGEFIENTEGKGRQERAEKGTFVINAKAFIERYLSRDANQESFARDSQGKLEKTGTNYYVDKYRKIYIALGSGCPVITPHTKKDDTEAPHYILYWAKSMLQFEVKLDLANNTEYWYFSHFHGIRNSMALDEETKQYLSYDELEMEPLIYLQEHYQDRELEILTNDCIRILLNLRAREKSQKQPNTQIKIPLSEMKESSNRHSDFIIRRFQSLRAALSVIGVSLVFEENDGKTLVVITREQLTEGKRKNKKKEITDGK